MIRTRSLAYAWPRGTPLRFADVDVPQGGTLLLLGASGAGKSTWLALAAGLLTATEGSVEVAGQDVGALRGAARDHWRGQAVGFLPQKLHLSEALTVQDNLGLAYFAAGVPRDARAIQAALQALGVAELAARRPSQLSGGQAQRVALARALLLSPRVILADEPTASLDDRACAAGVALLREAAARCDATLVIATHDRRVRDALPGAAVHRLGAADDATAATTEAAA